ncbi:glycosyltransferase family 2 protein [Aquimarina agarilytica]|uniref:glycosyltransferase family 2 protein n=1 Tax=Aquimarina agarilytica TaxID=1087449 RepID=UPI000287B68D|nr:glycosyltransferase family 2 protein [Aquimarina agarilytica]
MQLSVIVLNYNVRYFLELCLQSVVQATNGLSAEIIVVDNNSPDDSCAMVKKQFPNIKLIENKENVGFAKANNQAVLEAKGTYVCILNPDTVVTEHTFSSVLRKAVQLPNLGMLGVQLIDGKGRFLPESKRNLPTPKVSFLKIMGARFSHLAPYYVDALLPDKEGEIAILVGAFMLCKKIVYQKVGGFDEDYFMYGEDIDLSYKVQQAGYKNYYLGSESVVHFKGESTLKDSVYRKRFFGAMKLFYKKHFKSSGITNLFIYTGIKFSALLQTAKKQEASISFRSSLLLSTNDVLLQQLRKEKTEIIAVVKKEALQVYADKNIPICCFLDMGMLNYHEAIQLIKKYQSTLLYFRFIPKNSKFAVGSDTSSGRGQVIGFRYC